MFWHTFAVHLLLAAAGLTACSATARRPVEVPRPSPPPLELEIVPSPLYGAPIWTPTGEWSQVFFHLNIFNKGRRDVLLQAVELRAFARDSPDRRGSPVQTRRYERAQLAANLRPLPWIVIRDPQTIAAANRSEGSFRQAKGDAIVQAGDGVSLLHQLFLGRSSSLPDQIECIVRVGGHEVRHRVAVSRYRQQTRLRLPFEGRWLVVAGHTFGEPHGNLYLRSEAFAYDFSLLGVNLETFSGDPRQVPSYRAYRRPVLAAASGQVVAVNDGIADQRRPGRRPNWQRMLQRPAALGGNYVVIRHEGDEHSAYLHLRRGLAVKMGDWVEAGQIVGHCGNSGNSSEPHLHFQLQDGPDPLTAAGLPARFGDLTLSYGRLKLYAPPERPTPLPSRMLIEHGRREGAVEQEKLLSSSP